MKDIQFQNSILSKQLTDHVELIIENKELIVSGVQKIAQLASNSLSRDGTIFWCGNGGSAADSQHLAADLVCRFIADRIPLKSVALTTDSSILTAISNDYSFDKIFARQLKALGKEGDILIAISTSGNSRNIKEAVLTARNIGIETIGLLGRDGGISVDLFSQKLIIPSNSTARIQEVHILIGHLIIDLIEKNLNLLK
tara:strand:+ start:349 stop:942 length:594 start_codon:yes stop_codon:yes gene_type:complete